MKYSLNEYLPYIEDKTARVVIYPNKELAARIVSEYKARGADVKSLYELISKETNYIPNPGSVVRLIDNYAHGSTNLKVLLGVESYLAFLSFYEVKEFFIGIRNFFDRFDVPIHILISKKYDTCLGMTNPKYEDSMYIVQFDGQSDDIPDLNITLVPDRWGRGKVVAPLMKEAMAKLGSYVCGGSFFFSIEKDIVSGTNHDSITVISTANDALQILYGINESFKEEHVDELLYECGIRGSSPVELLIWRFGGESYMTPEKAPGRLYELRNDVLWELYVWLLKSKLPKDTYIYNVLHVPLISPESFLREYIVSSAKKCMGDINGRLYAYERASVIKNLIAVDPLIAQFVSETESDYRSVPFLNCGTVVELQGLIRRAAMCDLSVRLPDSFDMANPLINCYLAPNYDYGQSYLTKYFEELRQMRLRGCVEKGFVDKAYESNVPAKIESRDSLLGLYDDGETGLLVVDGLGAEYYPLLVNVALRNDLHILEKKIVSANMPTSTQFNDIKWTPERRLQDVKQADNISHVGYAKFEKCSYEENLAEIMVIFQKTILTRVINGLKKFKKVVVTADHGSSFLAVNAHKQGLSKTIPWKEPDDWRYTAVHSSMVAPEGVETVYSAMKNCYYFVVKGYNRLSKQGGKEYGVHGGATLEERLVPFVIFTNERGNEDLKPVIEEQFIENSVFDIL